MTLLHEIQTKSLTLAQAAKKVPGRHRNPSTLWRWAIQGRRINGQVIKLEVLEVGRHLLTSEAAMLRFFQRCTEARQLTAVADGNATQSSDDTKQTLAKFGIANEE